MQPLRTGMCRAEPGVLAHASTSTHVDVVQALAIEDLRLLIGDMSLAVLASLASLRTTMTTFRAINSAFSTEAPVNSRFASHDHVEDRLRETAANGLSEWFEPRSREHEGN